MSESPVCTGLPTQPPVFDVVVIGETVIVVLRGELDVLSEGLLYGHLLRIREMRPSRLVFETAQVTYLDCASARLIAGSGNWLPPGVKPVISCPSPLVRRVLEASGIGTWCELAF
jgi:anti-anti-sigma factor